MTQHKPVLTDAEMHDLICGNPSTLGLSIARLKDFIRQVEKTVVAKLTEQEPIGYLHANEISFLSAKGITAEQARADDYNIPLYSHPMPSQARIKEALIFAAQVIELYDDASLVSDNCMLTSTDCAEIIKELVDYIPSSIGNSTLEQEVLCMVRMLESKEWADHAGLSELGQRLEAVISILHNELHEAQAKRSKPELARVQPCGCVVCYCENQERCLGCGAKYCGTHEIGEIPSPVYVDHIPDASKMVECAKCGNTAIHHLIMDNLGYPNKTPLCSDCTQEHEHLAQDTNNHEIRNFGGAYGLVAFHYEPLGTAQPDHIPDDSKMAAQALRSLTKELQADAEYAWSWHCNMAMPIMDSTGVSRCVANIAAARLMQHLFGIDTEKHPNFVVDHIPDIGQMITPLAQRKIQTLLDKGEYRLIENASVLVNDRGHAAIVNHGGAFYWVDNEALAREFDGAGVGADSDHIADMRKMVPEGWQLIPKEPTEQMRVKGGSTAIQTGGTWGCVAIEVYKAMLAAAPKYTGDKQ